MNSKISTTSRSFSHPQASQPCTTNLTQDSRDEQIHLPQAVGELVAATIGCRNATPAVTCPYVHPRPAAGVGSLSSIGRLVRNTNTADDILRKLILNPLTRLALCADLAYAILACNPLGLVVRRLGYDTVYTGSGVLNSGEGWLVVGFFDVGLYQLVTSSLGRQCRLKVVNKACHLLDQSVEVLSVVWRIAPALPSSGLTGKATRSPRQSNLPIAQKCRLAMLY
jgi:hypothetical protein